MNEPGMGKPGKGKPGMGKPGMGKPGKGEPGKGKAGKKLVLRAPRAVSRARFEAFTILMEVERGQGHADDLLRGSRVSSLLPQDRHLCTALVMGTLRWQIGLDAQARGYLTRPDGRLDPAIRIALRLGALQLQLMDRVPDHAAISESVELAKLAGHPYASRMVNAVLRMIAGQPQPQSGNATSAELAQGSAHPLWLVERWVANYGLQAGRAICEHGQQQPELAIRLANPAVEAELKEHGIELAPGGILTVARRVVAGDIAATDAFKTGRVRIQEEGSQLIAELCGHGNRILDACAAPGGKTLILAERNPQAHITACEISPARLEALKTRITASEYAPQIDVVQADATQLPTETAYDLALTDVPCSGTGTLGRNPEIRHRLKVEDLARHHERQCALLRGVLAVATGRVIYSTCSLEPEENAAVIAEVLAVEPGWGQVSVAGGLEELQGEGELSEEGSRLLNQMVAADGSLTILPGSLGSSIQTDGFFIAILERRR